MAARTNPNHDQRQPKKITVESFSNNQLESCNSDNKGILPSGSRENTPMAAESMQLAEYVDEKGFFSGNPFVEVTKGIIHIYKRKWVVHRAASGQLSMARCSPYRTTSCFLCLHSERTEIADGLSKTLCLLSVPATLNCHDLLNFVAPCHPTLQHIRIIRDGTPNQFMVLLE